MKKYLILIVVLSCALFITSCEKGGIIPNPSNELEEYINTYANSGISNIELLENDLQSGTFEGAGIYHPKGDFEDDLGCKAFFCKGANFNLFYYLASYGPAEQCKATTLWKIEDNYLIRYNEEKAFIAIAKILHYDGNFLLLLDDDTHPFFHVSGTYNRYKFIPGNTKREYYNNQWITDSQK